MEAPYHIRRVCEADLPLLRSWRAQPHVARWWGPPEVEPEDEMLRETRVALWIAEAEGRALAFLQDYRIADWLPHHFDGLPVGARGLDLYIGPPDQLGRGHGPRLLAQRVEALFAEGVPAAGIDPHPDNGRAIAAFTKAGFVVIGKPQETRWGRALLMARYAPPRAS
ncbi:acetyltransferase [Methylobacterium sp. C25]|nr:acetyltransferase [Methylobacterium sp. C25]